MILKKFVLIVPIFYLFFLGGCGSSDDKDQAQLQKLAEQLLKTPSTEIAQTINNMAKGNIALSCASGQSCKDSSQFVAFLAAYANAAQLLQPTTTTNSLEVRSADLQTLLYGPITLTGPVKHLITLNNGAVYLVYEAELNKIYWWDNTGAAQTTITTIDDIKQMVGATNAVNSRIAVTFDTVTNVVQIFDESGFVQALTPLSSSSLDLTILDDPVLGVGFLEVESDFNFYTIFDLTITHLYGPIPIQNKVLPRTDQSFWSYNDSNLTEFWNKDISNSTNFNHTTAVTPLLLDANTFTFAEVPSGFFDNIIIFFRTPTGVTGPISPAPIDITLSSTISMMKVFRNTYTNYATDYDDVYAVTSGDQATLNAYLWNSGTTSFDAYTRTFSGNVAKFARNIADATASSTKVAIVY